MIVETPNGVTMKQNQFTQQIKKYEMKYFIDVYYTCTYKSNYFLIK